MIVKPQPITITKTVTVTQTVYSNPFSRFLNELKGAKKLPLKGFMEWLLKETLAEGLKLTKQTVYFWMAGKGYPSKKYFPSLQKVFGIGEDAFLSLIPDEQRVLLDHVSLQHLAHVQESEGRRLTIQDVVLIAKDHELAKHFGGKFGAHFNYRKD